MKIYKEIIVQNSTSPMLRPEVKVLNTKKTFSSLAFKFLQKFK